MTEIEKVRKELLKLTRAVNQAKGEEKAKLVEQKEIVLQKYYKLRSKKWREEEERWWIIENNILN